MGQTIAEKIVAAHTGGDRVRPGEYVNAQVDMVIASELSGIVAIREFERWTGARILHPDRVAIVFDHFTPNKDIASAEIVRQCRDFARRHGVRYYDVGRVGIQHILLPEAGLISAGDLVAGADSHTCTLGALGAFGTGVGSTDAAAAMALGEVWLKVPESLRLNFTGQPGQYVGGKDLILHAISRLGVDGARYQVLEFGGEALAGLGMAGRFTMANMAIEAGAKTGIFPPDDTTAAYLKAAGGSTARFFASDPDAEYAAVHTWDVTGMEPQVAVPFLPANGRDVSTLSDITIDQVTIGMCTNGNLADLREAAGVLAGRKVSADVRAVIIPGSQKVYADAIEEGLVSIFLDAECAVSTPTCGPCLGGHMGVLAAGERCVSTSNRNFRGRMGHPTSEVYLANPSVAAASAVAGRIVSPAAL
ncbi:MAG: 3-isopropylmalate dehydratase large subunit [Anaerolineae bacterium]